MNTGKRKARTSFHPLTIATHWATLVLLAAVYATMELKGLTPKGSGAREAMKHWHFALGLAVFGLVALRLALRAIFPAAPIVPAPPAWQQRLAAAMHVALYLFLVAMPLLGWMTLGAKGAPVLLFGWELPALAAPDRELARGLKEVHEAIGTIGYGLIGVHAAAALFHHYVMHDNTLVLMLPWAQRRARKAASSALSGS